MSLDVNGNNIGPEGMSVLAAALKGNETLRTLEVGYNPISDKGAQALVDVLKYDMQARLSLPFDRWSVHNYTWLILHICARWRH